MRTPITRRRRRISIRRLDGAAIGSPTRRSAFDIASPAPTPGGVWSQGVRRHLPPAAAVRAAGARARRDAAQVRAPALVPDQLRRRGAVRARHHAVDRGVLQLHGSDDLRPLDRRGHRGHRGELGPVADDDHQRHRYPRSQLIQSSHHAPSSGAHSGPRAPAAQAGQERPVPAGSRTRCRGLRARAGRRVGAVRLRPHAAPEPGRRHAVAAQLGPRHARAVREPGCPRRPPLATTPGAAPTATCGSMCASTTARSTGRAGGCSTSTSISSPSVAVLPEELTPGNSIRYVLPTLRPARPHLTGVLVTTAPDTIDTAILDLDAPRGLALGAVAAHRALARGVHRDDRAAVVLRAAAPPARAALAAAMAALRAVGPAQPRSRKLCRACARWRRRSCAACLERASAGAEAVDAAPRRRRRARAGALRAAAGMFLGTLGNNAPFVGLFGTVLGIIRLFHDLSGGSMQNSQLVMAGIAEALVATGIGLIVALPAVRRVQRVRAARRDRRRGGRARPRTRSSQGTPQDRARGQSGAMASTAAAAAGSSRRSTSRRWSTSCSCCSSSSC